ncbi:MAG: hypothetical protein IT473_14620 [Lysobacter sp.]|nr:hypothetical protein [Lysobacter sp.]
MRIFGLAISFLLLMCATPALAQTTTAAQTPQALTEVYQCAAITPAEERLACYDAAVGRLRSAETQGRIVAVDREQAATIERESFGFHLPSLSRILPSLNGDSDEVEDVQLTVTRIRARADGTHSFVMDNGQVWTQVEPQDVRNVRAGDTITIERAALGSFRLIGTRGGAGHRVRREN